MATVFWFLARFFCFFIIITIYGTLKQKSKDEMQKSQRPHIRKTPILSFADLQLVSYFVFCILLSFSFAIRS